MNRKFFPHIATLLFSLLMLTGSGLQAQTIRIMPLGNSITRGSMCMSGTIYSMRPFYRR